MAYVNKVSVTDEQVISKAIEIIEKRFADGPLFTSSSDAKDYLKCRLGTKDHEVFAVMFLDNQHSLIEYKEMFTGTIDAATVYPREVAKRALLKNAAAVVLAHNHPSGISEPSLADKQITQRIIKGLALIDIKVLDHIIIAKESLSFAESGLL
ncbi:RadC family protein [Thalassotalea sp. PS06]|uniref:RadC family protein n=1 Tax=Thalassotalea sp. PS06 TaxID=2594005 RepID=UPI0011627E53|nr:DNA repair protein RadC [Thalassotalea sp. PS06]QDP02190.1 DNA repair protein RadC [Thalassotalea sp. PS06]